MRTYMPTFLSTSIIVTGSGHKLTSVENYRYVGLLGHALVFVTCVSYCESNLHGRTRLLLVQKRILVQKNIDAHMSV